MMVFLVKWHGSGVLQLVLSSRQGAKKQTFSFWEFEQKISQTTSHTKPQPSVFRAKTSWSTVVLSEGRPGQREISCHLLEASNEKPSWGAPRLVELVGLAAV